jgi:hypothetical protein
MGILKEHIDKKKDTIITFKDRDGKYHIIIKSFESYESYESYCETRMRQSGWKEIGTNIPPKEESV